MGKRGRILLHKLGALGVREVVCPLPHDDLHRGHPCPKCQAQL